MCRASRLELLLQLANINPSLTSSTEAELRVKGNLRGLHMHSVAIKCG